VPKKDFSNMKNDGVKGGIPWGSEKSQESKRERVGRVRTRDYLTKNTEDFQHFVARGQNP